MGGCNIVLDIYQFSLYFNAFRIFQAFVFFCLETVFSQMRMLTSTICVLIWLCNRILCFEAFRVVNQNTNHLYNIMTFSTKNNETNKKKTKRHSMKRKRKTSMEKMQQCVIASHTKYIKFGGCHLTVHKVCDTNTFFLCCNSCRFKIHWNWVVNAVCIDCRCTKSSKSTFFEKKFQRNKKKMWNMCPSITSKVENRLARESCCCQVTNFWRKSVKSVDNGQNQSIYGALSPSTAYDEVIAKKNVMNIKWKLVDINEKLSVMPTFFPRINIILFLYICKKQIDFCEILVRLFFFFEFLYCIWRCLERKLVEFNSQIEQIFFRKTQKFPKAQIIFF